MNRNIICTGNDLDQVCADIEARGGRVESCDTGVLGNAGYRVNYFSPHQAEIPVKRAALVAVKSAVAPRDPLNGPKIPCHGPACNPEHRKVNQSGSAETVGVEKPGCHAPVVGESSEVPGCETSGMTIAATITNEKHGSYFERVPELAPPSPSGKALTGEQCQQVNNPAALATVAGRTSLICEVTGKSQRERQMEETPPEMVNPSIEDRLQRLHATLKENGKLRNGKPSIQPHHARLPHPND